MIRKANETNSLSARPPEETTIDIEGLRPIAQKVLEEARNLSTKQPENDMLKWRIFGATGFLNGQFQEEDTPLTTENSGGWDLISLAGIQKSNAFQAGDFEKSEEINILIAGILELQRTKK